MDVALDDDQLALQAAAADVLAKECSAPFLRSVVDGGHDAEDLWATLASLDWPGLAIAAADGGVGGTFGDLAIVIEQLGYVADPTPFVATTTQFASVVAACGSDEQRRRFLEPVATGSSTGTLALAGPDRRWDLARPPVRAERTADGWALSGSASWVLDGDRVHEVAVVAQVDDGLGVFVVPASSVAVTRTETFDGALHLAEVRFDGAVVGAERRLAGPDVASGLQRTLDEATTGLALAMVGACQRALDLVVAYVGEREQFGVPIGSFQAVKHQAVDMHLAIERARSLAWFAALTIAEGDDRRSLAASLAKAAAGDAQHLVFQHAIQLYGGIGFTWENDVHLYLRRAKAFELLLGGTARHRDRVSELLLAAPAAPSSVLTGGLGFDDETEAFRHELEGWLDEHAPPADAATERPRSSADIPEWARRWQRSLFDAGWLVPGNAPERGGRNATLIQQFVAQQVFARRGIYPSFNPQALGIVVPSLLAFGSPEQQEQWALPLLRAEITAALGMSEPNAGSDLAGLRTQAVRDGDRFTVNGQKVWTSGAHDADIILTFVRTNPDVPKHKGISVLVIPTDLPGVTRRPFGSVIGPEDQDFNEVFFDDVEVPIENLIGELDGGWRVANGSLGHERAMLWLEYSQRMDEFLDDFAALALSDDGPHDARALDTFARAALDAQALRLLGYRAIGNARRGHASREESILKLFGSEAVQRTLGEAIDGMGPTAFDPTPQPFVQPPPARYLQLELVPSLPAQLRRHHRRRHERDPTQHRRRTSPQPPPLNQVICASHGRTGDLIAGWVARWVLGQRVPLRLAR